MKPYKINDKMYLILFKYFNGSIDNLKKDELVNLKKGLFNGEDIEDVDEKIIKDFKKLLKFKDTKYDKYIQFEFIYPEWKDDKEIQFQKLKEYFPNDKSPLDFLKDMKVKTEYGEGVVLEDGKEDDINIKYTKNGSHKKVNYKKVETIKEDVGWGITKVAMDDKNEGDKNDGAWGFMGPEDITLDDDGWNDKLEEDVEDVEDVEDDIYDAKIYEIEKIDETIIPQRKAFIDWINNEFYKKQGEIKKEYDKLNIKYTPAIYQLFVKNYLSINTPFRGLLVYHGLGTGKSASSIITAEGLSKDMEIFTVLPASLENEYVKEIQRWGNKLFNIGKNNWSFVTFEEYKRRRMNKLIDDNYNLNYENMNEIIRSTRKKFKLKEKINGIFINSNLNEDEEIYTITGKKVMDDNGYSGKYMKLNDDGKVWQKHMINEIIKKIIINKYNFVHYNSFPNFEGYMKGREEEGNESEEDDENVGTTTQRIVKKLVKKLNENKKRNINSPFYNNVVIIDEVHNFVSQISNGKNNALIFYNWIMNSKNSKFIFLSGTPLVNKPSEIAILFNMLRGNMEIFEFSLISDKDIHELEDELKSKFYKQKSTIEQLRVYKKSGKSIVSFTRNHSNFTSIINKDNVVKTIKYNEHSFDDFMKEIFNGMKGYKIKPDRNDYEKNKVKLIKNKKPYIFDKEISIPFNNKLSLFEINVENEKIDLMDNSEFMNYFFNDDLSLIEEKKILLRRMLLGLISYYPIDRSSVVRMPTIVKPFHIVEEYKDHTIINNINVIPIYMSYQQLVKYEEQFSKEREIDLKNQTKKNLYNDEEQSWHFKSSTRQVCNVVFEDDTFKTKMGQDKGEKEQSKKKAYQLMKDNGNFLYEKNLKNYSPKSYQILTNAKKFIDEDGNPSGKILFYSNYKEDGGSGFFQEILKQQGYEKFDIRENSMNDLIKNKQKKKRYTLVTGGLDKKLNEQRENIDAFNHSENKHGEYIQYILISSAGAEGISLTCVRQVHIMEPYWYFSIINQVFGRAIRMDSHEDLPEEERNVEQYLYLSIFPDGNSIESIFQSIKKLNWDQVKDLDSGLSKQKLNDDHNDVFKLLQNMQKLKENSNQKTSDQLLFDISERKNKISLTINDIIKESSVDCIQNTRDNIQLNNNCLRFLKEIKNEDSHFPGLSSENLNEIDKKQFDIDYLKFIEPDIYIIAANKKEIYVYYQMKKKDKIDVRYVKENGLRLGDYHFHKNLFFYNENKSNNLNDLLTNKFSVYQSIYKIKDFDFESIDVMIQKEKLIGYSIKNNINENIFFTKLMHNNYLHFYDYNEFIQNKLSFHNHDEIRFIIRNKKLYIIDN